MNTKNQTIEEIIREIESGKFRDDYLIYDRKSTDEPNNQKNSLKYQKSENVHLAFREKLPIAKLTLGGFCTDGIISERHSAFKENFALTFNKGMVQYQIERPKFYRLAEWLSKGYFKGVIFLCWDRASRNQGDETIIRKLIKTGVDIRFALTSYDKSSSGELHMDIDGMFAEHHSRVTREKVSLTIKNSRARGLVTHKAPVGYLNEGTMEHKPFDPVRAPIIKKFFGMYASGDWSLIDLARWATEQGFMMPPARRRRTKDEMLADEENDERIEIEKVSHPPTANNIHMILTNQFYIGKTIGNDGVYVDSTSHKALVDDGLFNQVQELLHKRNKSAHYDQYLNHPLRGLIHCALCKRVYTPYPKKGHMYYGARCSRGCPNPTKSFNFDYITGKIGKFIENLSFTDEELEIIDARMGTDIALLEAKRLSKLDDGERRKKKIREDLAYLNANRLTLLKSGAYTPEMIVAEDTKLNFQLTKLCDEEQVSDISIRETVKEAIKLSELTKRVYLYYENALPHEKEEIIKAIFSELTLNEDTLEYQCKKGFQPLSHRFIHISALGGNRTSIISLGVRCSIH